MSKFNLPKEVWFVRVRAEGIPTIENGRIFFFDTRAIEDDWKPPMEMPGLSLNGKDCVEHWAGAHMPTNCHCGKLLRYSVVSHSWSWMTGVFACPDHPHEVWVDYYPKCHGGDTGQDRFNAYPQYADRAKKVPMASEHQLLRYQVIQNEDEIQGFEEQKRREAPLLFKLTPDGLVPIHIDFKTRVRQWWQALVSKVPRAKFS